MTSFEEEFPSLKSVRSNLGCRQGHINCVGNEEDDYVLVSNIQKHCLDKQRVRDVIWDLRHAMQNCHGDLMITREKQLELLKRFEELTL